jgi:hypothetical protein
MENPLLVILPLLALVLASISVGGLWYWWHSTRDQNPPEESLGEEPPSSEANQQEAAPDPTVKELVGKLSQAVQSVLPNRAPPPSSSSLGVGGPVLEGDAVEAFRVLRDLADGSLIVEIDRRRYRNLNEITDPQVGRRFMGNVQALAQFARLGDINFSSATAQYAQPEVPQPTISPPAGTGAPSLVAPPGPPPSVIRGQRAPEPPQPARPFGKLFQQSAPAGPEEAEGGPKTIADEIEELLQYRLTLNPAMAQHSMHIRSTPEGGVQIEVDGRVYDGVGEVSDVEAKAFIQSVIREWEARQ